MVCVRIIHAKVQRLAVGVFQIAYGLTHDRRKQIVARIEHRRARAEVLPQHHAARCAVRHLIHIGKSTVFLQENGRVRQTEAINTLFDITNKEQIALLLRQRAENRVLHSVCVLIFVHRDLSILLTERARKRRGLRPVVQQAHRKMLQIVEVRRIARALGIGKRLFKGIHHVDQRG